MRNTYLYLAHLALACSTVLAVSEVAQGQEDYSGDEGGFEFVPFSDSGLQSYSGIQSDEKVGPAIGSSDQTDPAVRDALYEGSRAREAIETSGTAQLHNARDGSYDVACTIAFICTLKNGTQTVLNANIPSSMSVHNTFGGGMNTVGILPLLNSHSSGSPVIQIHGTQ